MKFQFLQAIHIPTRKTYLSLLVLVTCFNCEKEFPAFFEEIHEDSKMGVACDHCNKINIVSLESK